MAVGLVCHSRSERLHWPSSPNSGNAIASSGSLFHSGRGSMAKRPPDDNVAREEQHASHTRLPSFSNFLSGAGQADLTSPPRITGAAVHSAMSPGYGRSSVFSDPDWYARPHSSSSQIHSIFSDTRSVQTSSPRYESVRRLSLSQDQPDGYHEGHGPANPPPFLPTMHQPIHAQHYSYGASTSPEAAPGRNVVGEDIVPGKGRCYVYDDGSVCQKIINGDMVNPKWGTTKAGKPRKRLGQACNTCREKKIKCDPSVPKCAQCQKFNRDCKFETNPRSVHKGSNATSVREDSLESDTNREKMHSTAESTPPAETPHDSTYVSGGSRSSMNVENLLSPASVEDIDHASHSDRQRSPKRPRLSTASVEHDLQRSMHSPSDDSTETKTATITAGTDNIFSIHSDPFDVDIEVSSYYLGKYFTNVNVAAFYIFPQKDFMKWAQKEKDKSQWDRMLLYSMMAAGANSIKKQDEYQRFAEIAALAVGQSAGVFELQLVQTRLILSLMYSATDRSTKAWDLLGSAIRTAYGTRLNVEQASATIAGGRQVLFGLDVSMLDECKRRTLWAAYIMDCLHNCYPGYLHSMKISDCLVRLPCSNAMYEDGTVPGLPQFDSTEFDLGKQLGSSISSAGIMAFLVQICTILNQIVTQINKPPTKEVQPNETMQEAFHQDIIGRLQTWDRTLRQFLDMDPIDSRVNSTDSSAAQDTGLHIFYHYAVMLLCRHVHFQSMSPVQLARNCKKANTHARRILELMLRMNNREDVPEVRTVTTNPLTGHIILTAMDVITAGGSMSNLVTNELGESGNQQTIISLVFGSIEALEGLAEHWISAKDQIVLARQRVQPLLLASQSPGARRKAAFFARKSLLEAFQQDLDVVYGLSRLEYVRALGCPTVRGENDLYEL